MILQLLYLCQHVKGPVMSIINHLCIYVSVGVNINWPQSSSVAGCWVSKTCIKLSQIKLPRRNRAVHIISGYHSIVQSIGTLVCVPLMLNVTDFNCKLGTSIAFFI